MFLNLPNRVEWCYRCETFNSYIRAKNIFGNKSAPSCDIAHRFAVLEEMRYICDGGRLPSGQW